MVEWLWKSFSSRKKYKKENGKLLNRNSEADGAATGNGVDTKYQLQQQRHDEKPLDKEIKEGTLAAHGVISDRVNGSVLPKSAGHAYCTYLIMLAEATYGTV